MAELFWNTNMAAMTSYGTALHEKEGRGERGEEQVGGERRWGEGRGRQQLHFPFKTFCLL